MRRWILMAVLCGAVVGRVEGQRLLVAGGVSLPQGNLNSTAGNGWHALAGLQFGSPMHPLGLRFDVAYNRFGFDSPVPSAGDLAAGSATLNLTYELARATSQVSPYLITGLGAYHTDCSEAAGCDGQTRYGWNIGLGARFRIAFVQSFLEARYHRTTRDGEGVHFIPLTLGFSL